MNSNTYMIHVKYFSDKINKIEKIEQGDWIDLRAAETISLAKGEFALVPLGVGMKLPANFEAHLAPRSSTFKKYKVIQTNGIGVIDNSYSGENDQWMMPVLAIEDTVIPENERICQFRIVERQPNVSIVEVDHLDDQSRGGFGSTGSK